MAIEFALDDVVAKLGYEERCVLLVLAERLYRGQRQYGELNLARDTRDLSQEASEEAADLAIYNAMKIVQDNIRRAKGIVK